jgi:hypothetical protein
MGTVAVDVSNMVEVNAIGFRALSDALGDDGARVFINQFKDLGRANNNVARPRVATSRIADILERAEAEAEAGRGKGNGDATKEKYDCPQMSFEEVTERIMATDVTERARFGL